MQCLRLSSEYINFEQPNPRLGRKSSEDALHRHGLIVAGHILIQTYQLMYKSFFSKYTKFTWLAFSDYLKLRIKEK